MCPKLWVVLVLIRPVLACLLSQGSSGRFPVPLRLLYDPCCRWCPGFRVGAPFVPLLRRFVFFSGAAASSLSSCAAAASSPRILIR